MPLVTANLSPFAATAELSWQAGHTHQQVLNFFSSVPGESAPNSAPAAWFLSLMAFLIFRGGEMFPNHPQITRAEFSIAAAEPSWEVPFLQVLEGARTLWKAHAKWNASSLEKLSTCLHSRHYRRSALGLSGESQIKPIQDSGRGWNIFEEHGMISQPYWGQRGVDDHIPGVRVSSGASGEVSKVNLEGSQAEIQPWPILLVLLAVFPHTPKVYISQNSSCFQPQKLNKGNNHGKICQFGINLGRKCCCC